jgi:DNA-directed RNA polymerase subunit RPC12/RpoP
MIDKKDSVLVDEVVYVIKGKKPLLLTCGFCRREFEIPRLSSKKYTGCPHCGTYRRIYE